MFFAIALRNRPLAKFSRSSKSKEVLSVFSLYNLDQKTEALVSVQLKEIKKEECHP